MKVGQNLIRAPEEYTATQKAYQRSHPGRSASGLDHFDGRCQQRPETGGYHDTGRTAKQAIHDFSIYCFKEKDHGGP